MTPKERQDAIRELQDMAYEHERRAAMMDGRFLNAERDRAAMLRAVAAELARESQ